MDCQLINIHTHCPTGKAVEPSFAGIHPWQAETRQSSELLSQICGVDIIGEIGLDYACKIDREVQLRFFREQLILAEQYSKPVILHCVKAFEPVMRELAGHTLPAVIFHGFIGSAEQAMRAVEKGYYLSFGERTFSSPRTIEALRRTPPDRLFAETDQSELSIEEIYHRIAQAKNMDFNDLRCQIAHNYHKIFNR